MHGWYDFTKVLPRQYFALYGICDIGIATCVNVIVLYERLVCFVGYLLLFRREYCCYTNCNWQKDMSVVKLKSYGAP